MEEDENGKRVLTVEEGTKYIAKEQFKNCKIYKVFISEGLEGIRNFGLYGNPIKKIVLPESLKYIGYRALSNTLLEEIVIPAGIDNINPSAFENSPINKMVFFVTDKKKSNDDSDSSIIRKVKLSNLEKVKRFYTLSNNLIIVLCSKKIIYVMPNGDIKEKKINETEEIPRAIDSILYNITEVFNIPTTMINDTAYKIGGKN